MPQMTKKYSVNGAATEKGTTRKTNHRLKKEAAMRKMNQKNIAKQLQASMKKRNASRKSGGKMKSLGGY